MYPCYNNIIGLSKSDCECLATNRPEDYQVSNSGLFLDELADIGALIHSANCGSDLWETITDAMQTAIKLTVTDSNILLGKTYALKREPLNGQVVGDIKARETYNPAANYAVIRIACNPIKGGYFTLRKLGTIFEAIGSFNVSLYNNVDGFLESFAVTSLANKHLATPLNKKYPVYSKYTNCLEYYLVYEFDDVNRPKDNAASCGCGGETLNYNLASPYFAKNYRNAQWTKYVMVGSTVINSLSELEDGLSNVASNKMLGLTLELDFACDVNSVICDEDAGLDFTGNKFAMALAFAIYYQTGVQLANKFLNNKTLDPKKLINTDKWEENAIEWQAKYSDYLTYLVSEVSIKANDCFTCKDLAGMTRQGLFA
jgi:hypothetical protein